MLDNDILIRLVHERRCLWDVDDKKYNNREFAKQKWEEIATILKSSTDTVKSKWQNLRDTYRRESQKPSSRWKFLQPISFLEHVYEKKIRNEIEETQEILTISTQEPPIRPPAKKLKKQIPTKIKDNAQIVQTQEIGVQNECDNVKDEDYYFLMSLLPHLRSIPHHQKLRTRIKLQQVLLEDQEWVSQMPPGVDVALTYSNSPLASPSNLKLEEEYIEN